MSQIAIKREGIMAKAEQAGATTRDFIIRTFKFATIVMPLLGAIALASKYGQPSWQQVATVILVQIALIAGVKFVK